MPTPPPRRPDLAEPDPEWVCKLRREVARQRHASAASVRQAMMVAACLELDELQVPCVATRADGGITLLWTNERGDDLALYCGHPCGGIRWTHCERGQINAGDLGRRAAISELRWLLDRLFYCDDRRELYPRRLIT